MGRNAPVSIMPSIAVTFHYSGKTAPTSTLKSAMTERLCSFSEVRTALFSASSPG